MRSLHLSACLLGVIAFFGAWSGAGSNRAFAQPMPSPEDERAPATEGAPDAEPMQPSAAEPTPSPAQPSPTPAPPPSPAQQPSYADPQEPPPPPPPPPPTDYGAYGGSGAADERAEDDRYRRRPADEGEYAPDDYGGSDDEIHEFSVRLDPFNWLIQGRLGLELEVGVWKFISVELVPIFVTTGEPPAFNFAGRDDPVSQESNGIGPISGASLGVGFWLSGEPFRGYVLRAILTNYGYAYEASDGVGVFDRVKYTERRFVGFFGSHSRFGAFTFAGGLGLGYELNQQERCGLVNLGTATAPQIRGRDTDCDGEQQIAVSRRTQGVTSTIQEVADLNGPLHPIYLEARFSLGFVF